MERRVIAYAHQGGAWEAPSLHAPRHRRRRSRPGPPVSSSTSTPPPTAGWWCATTRPSIAPPTVRGHRRADLRRAVAPWTTPTGGPRAPTSRPGLPPDRYPYRGRAPEDRRFGIALLEEVLEEFPGVVLNLDIKQTAPVVAPYEEALAAVLRRFGRVDDVIVASFLDSATDAFSAVRTGDPDLGRHGGGGRLLPGGPGGGGPRAHAPRRPAGAGPLRRADPGRRAVRRRRPPARAWPSTCGPSRRSRRWTRLCELGVDGIITDRPTALVGVLDELGCAWRPGADRAGLRRGRRRRDVPGRGERDPARASAPGNGARTRRAAGLTGRRSAGHRPGSAPTAVRLLAVVGLLLGPELALVGSFRHSSEMLVAGGPLGHRDAAGRRPVTWLLRDGDVLAAAEVAETFAAAHQGTARADGLRRGHGAAPDPLGPHLRACGSPSTWPSATRTWWWSG